MASSYIKESFTSQLDHNVEELIISIAPPNTRNTMALKQTVILPIDGYCT